MGMTPFTLKQEPRGLVQIDFTPKEALRSMPHEAIAALEPKRASNLEA